MTDQAWTLTVVAEPLRFELGDESWHSGRGWYYWDPAHPDEGVAGPFETRAKAEKHAREGYPDE